MILDKYLYRISACRTDLKTKTHRNTKMLRKALSGLSLYSSRRGSLIPFPPPHQRYSSAPRAFFFCWSKQANLDDKNGNWTSALQADAILPQQRERNKSAEYSSRCRSLGPGCHFLDVRKWWLAGCVGGHWRSDGSSQAAPGPPFFSKVSARLSRTQAN